MLVCTVRSPLHTYYLKYSKNIYRNFIGTCCLSNHYDTLKVSSSASLKEIKEAYFKLSKQYHPDLNPNDAVCQERFIELQEAYKVLGNADSRRRYDTRVGRSVFESRSPSQKRPYGYPDFTKRDEWLKRDGQQRQEEADFERFRQEYRSEEKTPGFKRQQTAFHDISHEEMDKFMRTQKLLGHPYMLYFFIAGMIALGIGEMYIHYRTIDIAPFEDFKLYPRNIYEDKRYENHPIVNMHHIRTKHQAEQYRKVLNREVFESGDKSNENITNK